MDDDKNGKEGPGLFTEHGDEEGENSDSGGSNVEEEHVRPYEHDPSFKSKEELEHFLKGKLGDFFLMAQSFYRPKTKTSFNRQFSPKRPKIGKKSGQRVQNSPNKDQVASELLWESINSVLRPSG